MSQQNYVLQVNLFMEFGKRNRLTSYERMFWLGLFQIANTLAQNSENREWPDDYFPVRNSEITEWTGLEERNIRAIRNRFQQIGLICFRKGDGKRRDPEYRIFYLRRIGYKIAPDAETIGDKNVPDEETTGGKNVPDSVGDSVGEHVCEHAETGGKNVPDSVGDPFTTHSNPNIYIINAKGEREKENANVNTHTQTEGNNWWNNIPRAREGEYIGLDGERHNTRYDSAWQVSVKARGAVAQRLINGFPGDPLPYDEHEQLMEALKNGVAPEAIEDIAVTCERRRDIYTRIGIYAKQYGFTDENRIMNECLFIMGGNQKAAESLYRTKMRFREGEP